MSEPSETAPVELAGNFLEWQLIEDEKDALAVRSKDLFKAMKGKGYDTKAARAAFREKRANLTATIEEVAKAEEAEAALDLYRSALDRGLAARARLARNARENIEEIGAEINRQIASGEIVAVAQTGELTDTQEQPETARKSLGTGDDGDSPSNGAVLLPTPQGAADGTAHRSVVTAGETALHSPSPETPQATADEEASPPAASSAPNPNPQPNLLPGAVKAPEADSSPASGAVLSEAEIPQFLKADRGFNNPRCKHPDTCSKAHSKDTCLDCTLAWADLPKAEQVLRWQDAVAASETEAV